MKGSPVTTILMLAAGLLILVIIVSTAFGKGVVVNFLNYFVRMSPEFLSEDIATFLTVTAYTPGNITAGIQIEEERNFELTENKVTVEDPLRGKNTTPIAHPNYVKIIPNSIKIGAGKILYIEKINDDITIIGVSE